MSSRALAIFFAVWIVGAQVAELFAAIGIIGVAVVLLAELFRARKRPEVTGDVWLLVAFLFATVFFPLLCGAVPTGTGLSRMLSLATIPLAAAATRRLSPRAFRAALIAGGVTLALSCLVAGLQHFGVWPSAEKLEGFSALKLPFGRVYEEVPNAPGRYMGGGLFFHRLKFAHVTGFAVLAAAGIALHSKGRTRAAAAALAALSLVSVFWFPFARAAAGAVGLALIALAFVAAKHAGPKARKAAVGAGAASALFLLLLLALNEPLRTRLLSAETEEGSGGRRHLISAGVTALKTRPITGLGLGRFKAYEWIPAGAPDYLKEQQGKAHNQLLSIAIEAGLPAALLFVAFMAALAIRLWRAAPVAPSGVATLLYLGALFALHDPFFHAEFGFAAGLALGVPLAFEEPPPPKA